MGTILSTRLGALLAGALSMGAGSTYRWSRSVSCCSRPQPTPQSAFAASGCGRIRARADLGVRERPTHPRIHTAPAAELLSKVTAIGPRQNSGGRAHRPRHWTVMYSGGRELASCLGSTSPTCICVDTLNGGCLLCTLAGLLVDFVSRPHRSPRLSLDMEVDRAGWGSSPSAILPTLSPQYVTYGTGEGNVRSCGSRARTG